MGVGAVLGDDHLGSERLDERRDDRGEGVQPHAVGRAGEEGHVDGRAPGVRPAQLAREAGVGEEVQSRFVQGDGEDTRVTPEDALDSVCVVGIEVDVGDAVGPEVEQPPDRRRHH